VRLNGRVALRSPPTNLMRSQLTTSGMEATGLGRTRQVHHTRHVLHTHRTHRIRPFAAPTDDQ